MCIRDSGGTVKYDGTPAEVFSHYKELEQIGLSAPQVTYVMEGLARRGISLPHNAITVEEAVDSILTAKEKLRDRYDVTRYDNWTILSGKITDSSVGPKSEGSGCVHLPYFAFPF